MNFKAFILALLFAVSLTACKKDNRSDAASIEGKWYLREIKYSFIRNDVEQVTRDTKSGDSDASTRFTFYDDGTGLQPSGDPFYGNSGSFNYTFSNSVLTVKPFLLVVHQNRFTVKLFNNEMTLTVKTINTDGSTDLNVLTLSKPTPAQDSIKSFTGPVY
jgi:hypothetical protein